jgi:hypothetical protein
VRRVPPEDGHPVPQSVDRGISELFGRIHADRRDGLYFELLTIGQAIGRSADLQRLASAIASVERDEARALPPTKDHDAPTRHGTFGLFVRTASDTPDPDCDIADNVIGVTLDTPIYRTIRHKYVRELMEHGSMPLAAPSLWDDPFERLICEARIHSAGDDGSSPRLLETLRRVAYGQCWSLNPESDAIWRIYSTVSKPPGSARNQTRDDEGVRLRTTIGRLLSAVSVACPSELRSRLFFGRVRYLYARDALEAVADELVRSAEGADAADSRARQTAESLLIKREPFAHEDECRLIVVDTRRGARQQQLFHVTIDEPNDIFKSITLDPRLSAEDVRERRQQLTAWGFKGEIVQSELYRPIQVDLERR